LRKRWDSDGVGWDTPAKEKKKGGGWVSTVRPAIPETGWKCPTEFPNLSAAKMIAFDLETRDPNLLSKGPGPRRKEEEGGFIAGLAVGVGPREGEQWYFPMRHEDGKHNWDPDMVMLWAKDNLCKPNQPKLGANLLYDLDWMWCEGVPVTGPYYDVQIAEPLIDESAYSYALELLAQKYVGEGKTEEAMYKWLALAFGGQPTRRDQAGNIWRAPAELAGPYAESDVRLPFQIWEEQQKVIQAESLDTVLDLETRLVPLLLAMRMRGVRVDTQRARSVDEVLQDKAKEYRARLEEVDLDPQGRDSLTAYCRHHDIKFKKTASGNPSFPGKWLENHPDENLRMCYQVRRLEKHAGTFIEGAVLGHAVADRVHCQFNQLRNDDFGAVSGRFSSSNPNLQNIPSRDEELGPLIRGLFLPDPEEDWLCDDWSQIEYRLLVHYAKGDGAAETRRRYRDDPTTDFHRYVADIANIDRKPAKNINFGLVYGMGEPAMAANMGRSLDEIKPIFNQYHNEFPFVKDTYNMVSKRATARGWLHTFSGRRRRFNYWEPRDWQLSREQTAKRHAEAERLWGTESSETDRQREDGSIAPPGIRRAGGHKALNSLLQGGAADIMKIAMVDIWESGICDVMGAPLLTVHDELNWSKPRTREADEAHDVALEIMENCVDLRVPLKVTQGRGENWGAAK
jgi:DNA polymerase I-like protein with 3'-5' exonuclease and polymerase domains